MKSREVAIQMLDEIIFKTEINFDDLTIETSEEFVKFLKIKLGYISVLNADFESFEETTNITVCTKIFVLNAMF